MLAIRKFKVCIDVKNGEFICPNPTIILKKHKDLLQNCEIKDGCIEFSILQEDEEKLKGICIPYTVICEDCGQCPTKDGEICFCDGNTDCDSCSNCIGGLCQPKCPKECVDGTCVDCTSGNCPTNQECLDGKCQCPPNKPYKDANGVCYGCQDDTQCPPCFRCDGAGNCVPRDCGTGQCDPLLDKCVECVSSDACKAQDPNKCCINNKCQCCTGFQLNPITGKCEPKPECERQEECGECGDCIAGKCAPIICPEGFKCDDGDCIPDPCKSAPCNNGTDCGPLCGCLEEECSECSKLTCSDCETALGCKCNKVTGKCEKVKDCDNPCVSKLDCDPNCGCDESTCKDCANYTCEECGQIPGCKCTNGKCGGDGRDEGCKDTFVVEKNAVCSDPKLIATLKKDVSCNCDPINFTVNAPTGSNNSFSVLPQKVTGATLTQYSAAGSPLTSDNEYKVSSLFKIQIKGTYTEDVNGVQSIKQFTTTERVEAITDFRSSFNLLSAFDLSLPNFLRLSTAEITVTQSSTSFDENKCGFNNQVIFSDSSIGNFNYNGQQVSYKAISTKIVDTKITSDSKRNPLFVWYEDLNTVVKREFVSGTTTFVSELLPDLYKTKKSYRVTNDCSCKKEAVYTWDCEKEKYFETADITYEIKDCGKTFKLLSVIAPCNPIHKKEVYQLFVNGIFFTNVVPVEALSIEGKSIRYEDGITSIQIKVKDTTCVKDYVVEPQEKFNLQIPSICNPSDGKTRLTISENISGTTTKIVSVKFGTSADSIVNTVTKVGGNFVIDTDVQIFVEITYSSNCKETITLLPKLDCCDNCSSTVSGSIDSKILFSAAGETGTLPKIVNSCNYNNITYTSDNELVTISSDGIISYTTPNNSLDVIVTINLGNGCTKEHQIIFEKVGLTLTLDKENGCDNPKLIVSGAATVGTQFKVRSSCTSNQDVWVGTWGGITLENTANQVPNICDYELYSVGGVTLPNPIKVTYNKLYTNTITLSVSQVLDDCNTDAVFEVLPHSSNLAGFSFNYTINGGATVSTLVVRENNKNLVKINRFELVNSNCSLNILALVNLIKDDCTISYNGNIPFILKCSADFTARQECINGQKSLVVSGPSNVTSYVAEYKFSNTNQVSTTPVNLFVSNNPLTFSIPYQNTNIVSAKIKPIVANSSVEYCEKEYLFVNLDCNKTSRVITGNLSGCLVGNTLQLSDNSTNKIVVKNVIDPNVLGIVSTDPNDTTKKYTIFVAYNNVGVISNQIIATKVGNDIVFTIPNVPNYGSTTKIVLNIKEDNQFLALNQEFTLVNNSLSISDWSIFSTVSSVNNTSFQTSINSGNTIYLQQFIPSFAVINLPQHFSQQVCVNYNNGLNLISSECKNSTPTNDINSPLPFETVYAVPLNATNIDFCRSFNGCQSCINLNIEWVTPTPYLGEYEICNGTARIFFYDSNNEYPQTIKYNGECYSLIDFEDLADQEFITIVDVTFSTMNYACSEPICQNTSNIIRYQTCGVSGSGPDLLFNKDNFYPTFTSAPEFLAYNGGCYIKVSEIQGDPNTSLSFGDIDQVFSNCNTCGIFVTAPSGHCGVWNGNQWLPNNDNCFEGQQCQPTFIGSPYYICQ